MADAPLPLAVDFGTCYSSAALIVDGRPQAMTIERQSFVPSTVFLNKRGEFLVGLAAERQKGSQPGSYQEEFKRVLGRPEKLTLGECEMLPEELVAKVLI